jgi:hypothetical protein
MHLREFNVDTMTARRAPSSPQTVVQTLFLNLLFLFFFPSLFTKLIYYFRSTTFDLLPLGYYPEAIQICQIRPPPCQRLFQREPIGVFIGSTVYRSQSSGSFVIDF